MTKTPKRPRTRKELAKKAGKWALIVGLVCTLIGVGAFVVLYQAIDIPDPNEDFETQTSFVYYADGKTDLGSFATQNRTTIPLDEMPQNIQDAVVAAENRTFWTDRGIDPRGILRAAFSNAQGNATQGASTITQQYVKILYLTQDRTLKRKIKEAFLSLKIHRKQSKSQILEGYLNTIYFGRGAYGIQAAAKAFFDVDAKDLTLKQSAVLATVLNNPSAYDPANGKQARKDLKERYTYVLDSMAETGAIEARKAEKAQKRLPAFPEIKAESRFGGQRGHMLKLVRDELAALGFSDQEIDGGGLRVTTTFTPKAMKAAEDGVMEARPEGFSDKQLHVAAASVEPGTGALKGFYAGQDYLDSQINWAVAGGMVGSTMKPFTIAAALEAGFSLKDTFEGNSPYEFPDGLRVRNEGTGPDGLGNDYGSAVNATYALEQSINTAFVDMSASIPKGPEKILEMANRLGVPPTTRTREYPGIPRTSRDLEADALVTLGKARISPINMANAYATIAAEGKRADVHVITKVTDANGEDLYTWKQPQRDDVDADVMADTAYAMQQVVNNGTGRTALALNRPVGGKTGTATNDKDQVSSAWFVGMTPQLSTAVMYVRGDGDDQLDGWLPSYFGSAFPASTWTAIMQRAMEGMEVEEFPPPANLDGDAPTDGHEPTTAPPASPTRQPSPTKTSETPTEEPSSEEPTTEAPPSEPAPSPSDSCGLLGECESPSSSDSPSPSGGGSPSGGSGSPSPSGQGGGQSRGPEAYRERNE